MGLPLGSPVAKLSCEAATEENAKRRSFMPRTQVTGKANFSPGITSGPSSARNERQARPSNFPQGDFISQRSASGACNQRFQRTRTTRRERRERIAAC